MSSYNRPDPKTQPEAWARYWAERIEEAQQHQAETIDGQSYLRIRYGAEPGHWRATCRDCEVKSGQLHVPDCCIERCGKCEGQRISCECGAREFAHTLQ